MIERRGARGFSLLEILIAFVGIAMLLGVLVRLFDNGLETVRTGERFTRATVIAQSRLAAAGFERPLEEGVTSGMADGRFRWRMTISAYRDEHMPRAPHAVQPLLVQVEVFWEESGESRAVSLTSIVLEPLQS